MDKDLEKNNNKNKKEKQETQESREQFRVVISAEANAAIEGALEKVVEGFDAGAITKSDIANFVFLNLHKFFSEADVKSLRVIHFDDKRMLGSLLRNENELPEDVKRALRTHFGVGEKEKRRGLRATNSVDTSASEELNLPPSAA